MAGLSASELKNKWTINLKDSNLNFKIRKKLLHHDLTYHLAYDYYKELHIFDAET